MVQETTVPKFLLSCGKILSSATLPDTCYIGPFGGRWLLVAITRQSTMCRLIKQTSHSKSDLSIYCVQYKATLLIAGLVNIVIMLKNIDKADLTVKRCGIMVVVK